MLAQTVKLLLHSGYLGFAFVNLFTFFTLNAGNGADENPGVAE